MKRAMTLLLLSFAFTPVLAQQTPKQDPQALVVLQRMQAATGWARALLPQDVVVQAAYLHSDSGGEHRAPVVLKAKGPRRFRLSTVTNANGLTIIVNGGDAVAKTSEGVRRFPSSVAENMRPVWLPILLPAIVGDGAPWSATYLGATTIGGESCHCIKLAPQYSGTDAALDASARAASATLCISSNTWLLTRLDYAVVAESNSSAILTHTRVFADYRTHDGIAVPFRQYEYVNGRLRYTLEISSIDVNVGVPDSDFEMPSGAKRCNR